MKGRDKMTIKEIITATVIFITCYFVLLYYNRYNRMEKIVERWL